jgi:hypothetical protein
VVVEGTKRPCLFPTQSLPMIRVPAMLVWIIGITSFSSDSKTLLMVEEGGRKVVEVGI